MSAEVPGYKPPEEENSDEELELGDSEFRDVHIPREIPTTIENADQVINRVKEATEEIDAMVAELQELLDKYGFDVPGADLAINEALVNAIYHGNWKVFKSGSQDIELDKLAVQQLTNRIENGESISGMVNILIDISNNQLKVAIQNEGEGFDWQKKLAEAEDLSEEKLKQNSKRGLLLILSYLGKDNVQFQDSGRRVVLTIHKKVTSKS